MNTRFFMHSGALLSMVLLLACGDKKGDSSGETSETDAESVTDSATSSPETGDSTAPTEGSATDTGGTSCTGMTFDCGCGDHFASAECKDGEWVCPDGFPDPGECDDSPAECSGAGDEEAPLCVDDCVAMNAIGSAICWVSGEWMCEEGVRADQCGQPAT